MITIDAKRTLLLFVLLSLSVLVEAQKKQNVYFLNKRGQEVKVKDSADFVRIIQEPDSGETNYMLYEFYMDDKKKLQGKVSSFIPRLVFEGGVISYNRKGVKLSMINYVKGKKDGMAFYYHSNGKLFRQLEYIPVANSANAMLATDLGLDTKVIFVQDSTGLVTIKDGNGHGKQQMGYSRDKGILYEEGEYRAGVKQGVWRGKYELSDRPEYIEVYDSGKLMRGESEFEGKKYAYTLKNSPPEYDGGAKAWADFIRLNTTYPKEAYEKGIQGTVLTSFVIDTTGEIKDIKIVKSFGWLLDNEAKRVLHHSPKWTPGKLRGLPTKVVYTQAFIFSIPKVP